MTTVSVAMFGAANHGTFPRWFVHSIWALLVAALLILVVRRLRR